MNILWQDVRHGIRMLAKSPGVTVIALVTLALGIGANTAIFTLINALLLNPLPGVDASRAVAVYTTDKRNTGGFGTFLPTSFFNARDYREMNQVFTGLAITGFSGVTLEVSGKPVPLTCELVSGDYFDVLGIKPQLGRGFLPEEDVALDAHPVAVLSYGLWQDQFGKDPGLVGKTITVNHHSFTVVGITPQGVNGENALGGPDLWVPNAMHDLIITGQPLDWYNERRGLAFNMIARLKPGVTFEQARENMQALAHHLETEYPRENTGRGVAMLPLRESSINPNFRGIFVRAGLLLQGTVGLVLLIACANVANLLLARGARRQREMAVRLSLGASRWRVVRQLLTESAVLSLAAGAGGILVAHWTSRLVAALRPPLVANALIHFSLDRHVLLLTLGISVVTGLLFGLAPARQAAGADLMEAMRERTDPTLRVNRWFAARNLLVVVQVTLSLVALVGAGLFVRSLGNAEQIDPGFETHRLLVVPLNLGPAGYDNQHARQFYQQALDRLRALPMVQSAGVGVDAPFGGGFARTVFPEGVDPSDRRSGKLTSVDPVEPGYFQVLGIPILQGRGFTPQDREGAPLVAVVNQTLARRLWPGQNPIGHHLHFFGETWNVEVVGVARDCQYINLGEDPQSYIYFALDQQMSTGATLYVHSKGDITAAVAPVRNLIQALDSHLPLKGEATVPEILNNALQLPRMGADLLGGFGLLALVLAAVGIYGVMSYSVSQRTREVGIRMALGAQTGDVMRLVLRHGMAIVGAGVIVGWCLALALTRFLVSLLFGLSPHDPITYAGVAAVLLSVALVACYLPARRATRVDPIVALRYE